MNTNTINAGMSVYLIANHVELSVKQRDKLLRQSHSVVAVLVLLKRQVKSVNELKLIVRSIITPLKEKLIMPKFYVSVHTKHVDKIKNRVRSVAVHVDAAQRHLSAKFLHIGFV